VSDEVHSRAGPNLLIYYLNHVAVAKEKTVSCGIWNTFTYKYHTADSPICVSQLFPSKTWFF